MVERRPSKNKPTEGCVSIKRIGYSIKEREETRNVMVPRLRKEAD